LSTIRIVSKPKTIIKANDSSSMDKLIKNFKQKVKNSQLLKEVYERSYYVKPSYVKRHKKLIGKYRNKLNNEQNNS
jgi:ribosomal protein S21